MPNYPERLLPKKDSKYISTTPESDVLCRWTSYPLKDETNCLSALAIEEKRIPDYSTNKIPPSVTEDILIAFFDKNILDEKWEEGDDFIPVKDEDFYYDTDRSYFFFKISSIDNFESTYPFPFSQDLDDYKFRFQVKVKHAPLKVNFSHFEFEIQYFDENGNPAKKPSRNSLEKVVIANIRDKLIKIAKFSMEDFSSQ